MIAATIAALDSLPDTYYESGPDYDTSGEPTNDAPEWLFDICEALYVWACEWGEYQVLDRLLHECQFRPAPALDRLGSEFWRRPNDENENADAIYQQLTALANIRTYGRIDG